MAKISEKINSVINQIKDICKDINVGIKKFFGIFKNINWLEIPAATYVRWILAFVVCLNSIITHMGLNPISISENTVYQLVSAILSISVLLVNTYKNNSTSKEALLSDKIMHSLKEAETNDENEMIQKLEGIIEELKTNNTEDHTNNEYDFVVNEPEEIIVEVEQSEYDDENNVELEDEPIIESNTEEINNSEEVVSETNTESVSENNISE